jgi:transposase
MFPKVRSNGNSMEGLMEPIWVGIDWGDQKHAFAVKDGKKIKTGYFSQTPEGIRDWVTSLGKKFSRRQICIALEQKKGALIFALLKYDFLTLYPINPESLANYRKTWAVSGAKDDPSDALLLVDILSTHQERFSPLHLEREETRLLQRLTEQRVKLVHDLKRAGNRLTSTLKEYSPQVLEIFPKIYKNIVAEFLLHYPTLDVAQFASDEELLRFFRSFGVRVRRNITEKIEVLRNATPLVNDSALITSNALFAKVLARELKALNESISPYEEEIKRVYEKHSDKEIINSLPAVGEIMGPRLLAALGTNRPQFASATHLACAAGIAPVIEQSGNASWTHWRFKCNKHFRQAFIDWTFLSIRESFWAENFYKAQRKKGKSHSVALRALAYKWIRIIYKIWTDRVPYNEARYLKALQNSGSKLCSL